MISGATLPQKCRIFVMAACSTLLPNISAAGAQDLEAPPRPPNMDQLLSQGWKIASHSAVLVPIIPESESTGRNELYHYFLLTLESGKVASYFLCWRNSKSFWTDNPCMKIF